MIYTERTVTIKNTDASIDSLIVLYRGDKDVEIIFKIVDSKFKFSSVKGNVIEHTQASFGQLAILNPNGTDVFSDVTACVEGMVTFKMTAEMMDELTEVGEYSFHIRLYNEDQSSRVTLPPIIDGIEVREPIVSEDTE